MAVVLKSLFGTSAVRKPFIKSGNLAEEEKLVHFPSTTEVHAGLLHAMVENHQSIVVVNPWDTSHYLHLLALEALFVPKIRDRNAIFLLSSNTQYREQFRHLAPKSILPPHTNARYSRQETPIANVTADGSLAKVTKNLRYPEKPARFLFSYTSTRIPSDEVGSRVRCVLYDDSVKYERERHDRLIKWRERNDVPCIVYFTSDPTSDLIQNSKEETFIWTWPPRLFSEVVEEDRERVEEWSDGEDECSSTTRRSRVVAARERNRTEGLSVEVHTCGGGDLNGRLKRANRRRARFEYLARKLDSETLQAGKPLVRYALGSFRELLTPLDISEFHARRRTLSSRIAGLERFQSRIVADPEASPAAGTFRDVVDALKELKDTWDDAPPGDKKEGVLVDNILYGVLERGESVSVVTASEGQQQALDTFLRSEYAPLYRDLGDDLSIHNSQSIRSSEPTDNVVLYGALRWRDRNLLRTDVATDAVILTYPIETALLRSQVEGIESGFDAIAAAEFWETIDGLTRSAVGREADVETLDIDVPEDEEAMTSSLGDEISVDEGDDEDIGGIVRGYETDYESDEAFDPSEYQFSSTGNATTDGGRTETGCVHLQFTEGSSMFLRERDKVHTIREGHDKLFKKDASKIEPTNVVVHLENIDAMRDKLYALIRERGDVGLYYYANMWKVNLEAALNETGDDIDDFIEKMRQQGLSKQRITYERWYNMEVSRTRSKKSFWAIAEAYELDGVKENFNRVWNAVNDMQTMYDRLKRALRQTALRSAARGALDDTMLSESPDVRLSDFEIGRYLCQLEVSAVGRDVEAKRSQIGRLQGM